MGKGAGDTRPAFLEMTASPETPLTARPTQGTVRVEPEPLAQKVPAMRRVAADVRLRSNVRIRLVFVVLHFR